MTKTEIKMNSLQKEIEKIQKSLERYEGILEKKIAKCEKLNCNWSKEEWFIHRDNEDAADAQAIAYLEKKVAESDVIDTRKKLENRLMNLEKVTRQFERESGIAEMNKEFDEKCESIETYLTEKNEEKFKEECRKDGIVIEETGSSFVKGKTKNGKSFLAEMNNGFTERSWKCYALFIDGKGVFTSGTFARCYGEILNH